MTNKEKLKAFIKIYEKTGRDLEAIKTLTENTAQLSDIKQVFQAMTKVMKDLKDHLNKRLDEHIENTDTDIKSNITEIKSELERAERELKQSADRVTKELENKVKGFVGEKTKEWNELINREVKVIKDFTPMITDLWAKCRELEKKEIKLDTPTEVRDKLELLKGEDRLDKTAIKGLTEFEKGIDKRLTIFGSSRGLFLFTDGATRGIVQRLDIVGGTNVTLGWTNENGLDTLTINGANLSGYVPYNDANQDILPTDDTVSLGSLISEKRFKHLHTSGVKVESEFTSTGAASAFGFTLSAVIGQTIGVTEELSNGVLTFGRTTTGNVQHAGSRVWLHTLNPVFYSIQRFNSITDNQHIWGFMTTGTDISDIQGIYFAKLTGETNIQARVRDGAGTQTTDTGVAVADATMQEFLIQVTNGRARFYINGVEVADISSNVPTDHLKWLWRIETSDTGTKTFGLDYAKIYQNRT